MYTNYSDKTKVQSRTGIVPFPGPYLCGAVDLPWALELYNMETLKLPELNLPTQMHN